MNEVLKGNYNPRDTVIIEPEPKDNLEQEFEKAALKRLGGSMAFVAKQKVVWSLDDDNG
jgi:hypothetical protein